LLWTYAHVTTGFHIVSNTCTDTGSSYSWYCSNAYNYSGSHRYHRLVVPSRTHTTTLLVHLATLEEPASDHRQTFEKRMRRLLRKNDDEQQSSPRRRSSNSNNRDVLPDNLIVVNTLPQYKAAVGDEAEKICVVRFFAPWCKACRAIQPMFYRLSQQYPDVKFVEVPVTEKNSALHQGLGVPSLPFGHIYFPKTGLVDELRISRKFFPQLELALKSYVGGSCDLIDGEATVNPFASQAKI